MNLPRWPKFGGLITIFISNLRLSAQRLIRNSRSGDKHACCSVEGYGMYSLTRRGFLTAGGALPLAIGGLSRLRAAEEVDQRVVELDLTAQQDWVRLGNRDAYAYAFNGLVPGPAIEARPGDRLLIHFHNGLVEPSNLHYHGLHVPSTGSADNAMLSVPPRESFNYQIDIPSTHPGGIFWYHPHVHEFAARQVSRGLAGTLIVRGDLDQIPEIAAAPEQIIVLQDFALDRGGVPTEPGIMEKMAGREGDLVTINGRINPTILIQRGGWIRLRFLNASSSRFYRLGLEEHSFHVIATDGGALAAPEEQAEILLAPGERVDAMVEATRPDASYRLINLPYRRVTGMGGGPTTSAPMVLATLTYRGTADQTWNLPQQLVSVDPLPGPSILRTFQLGSGMGMGVMAGGGMTFAINGRTFNPDRVDTRVRLNAVEDWEFVNPSTMDHPMHIHTNPFQVIGSDGAPIRAWKDVVVVPARSRVRVRTAFRDFVGRTMYHCHILDHEDFGMMGVLEIQGNI